MQRVPFSEGWAINRAPGWPVFDDDDDEESVTFYSAPASPDPSSGNTSTYEITASGIVSESSSIPTSGLPTPPPSAGPPIPIGNLIRAAAQRLQENAPDAAPSATPPQSPLRRSQRLAERARLQEESRRAEEDAAARAPVARQEAAAAAAARASPHRGPQRVAKMSTGGVRKQ